MNRRQIFKLFAGAAVVAGIPAVLIPASPDLPPIGKIVIDSRVRFDLPGMPTEWMARATIGEDLYDYGELVDAEAPQEWNKGFLTRALQAATRVQRRLASA